MSFNDMIKKSVLEGFVNSDITIPHILTVLAVALVLALYLFFIYRVHNRGNFYSREFNVAVAVMPVITAGIVLALQSSLVISLGMVGALSIVRFRTAVKEPMDLMFLFWSVGVGIICGAGLFALGIIVSLVVTVLVLVLDLLPEADPPMILSASVANAEAEKALETAARRICRRYLVKSRSASARGIDLIAEVRVKDPQALLEACLSVEGCAGVTLLSREGSVVRG